MAAGFISRGLALFNSLQARGAAHIGGTLGVVGASVFTGAMTATGGVTPGAGSPLKAINYGTLSVVHGTILPNRMGTVTMAFAGLAAADAVVLHPPAAPTAGLGYGGAAPAAGTVNVFLVNPTAGTVSPGTMAMTYAHFDLT